MVRLVALFRGINVGRAKRVPMAALRARMQTLGYGQVRTLLNSGNVVFDAAGGAPATHGQRIRAAVAEHLGVDAMVLVQPAAAIERIVAANPFPQHTGDAARLLVAMTGEAAVLQAMRESAQGRWRADEVQVGRDAVYLWCPSGVLESAAAAELLKGLGDRVTTRNWATLAKIHAALHEPAAG